jgi:hypothetical protein
MNDDRISFKIIMLILISNNFHLWIEELKDITLKIKIWKYINSNEIIKKFKKDIYFDVFSFNVSYTARQDQISAFVFTSTLIDLLTSRNVATQTFQIQISSSSQSASSKIRQAMFFHELNFNQQESYRTMIEEYRRREKQISKITQKMIKINEIIKTFARMYILSKMMSSLIRKILQLLIVRYKKIDD